jgi:hypothetical protein
MNFNNIQSKSNETCIHKSFLIKDIIPELFFGKESNTSQTNQSPSSYTDQNKLVAIKSEPESLNSTNSNQVLLSEDSKTDLKVQTSSKSLGTTIRKSFLEDIILELFP